MCRVWIQERGKQRLWWAGNGDWTPTRQYAKTMPVEEAERVAKDFNGKVEY